MISKGYLLYALEWPWQSLSLTSSILAVCTASAIWKIAQRLQRRSITYLRGPPSDSWLVGNLPQLLASDEAAEFDFKWTKEFGTAFRIHGSMGLEMLYLTDPKSLHYILNTTGYSYPRPQQIRATTRLIVGEGLVYAVGEHHARQRKLMNPAFSFTTFPTFFKAFRSNVHMLVNNWKQIIFESDGHTSTIDVAPWVSRTMLDIIGQVGFNYDFGTLDEVANPLAAAYKDLFIETTYKRSNGMLLFEAFWGYLPFWMVKLLQKIPAGKMKRFHSYRQVARGVAQNMIRLQTEQYNNGNEGGKDMLSILIRANLSEDPSVKISNNEIESQLTTLMLAGHDTTASSVMWGLYELSLNQDIQRRIRKEISDLRLRISERGNDKLSVADLESMKYFSAFIKEIHRFHPVVPLLHREATQDDVVPLSQPIRTKKGGLINSIPIGKGQRIVIGITAYNRLKSVWGDDADTFRPERFLESKEYGTTGIGVISNIMTFSSGIRSCIGWRFAVVEMQVAFMELLENFSFAPNPEGGDIIRSATSIVAPMLKVNPGKTSLPLSVSIM